MVDWTKNDTSSPGVVDWSKVNVGNVDYKKVLKTSYDKRVDNPFVKSQLPSYGANAGAVTLADATKQKEIDAAVSQFTSSKNAEDAISRSASEGSQFSNLGKTSADIKGDQSHRFFNDKSSTRFVNPGLVEDYNRLSVARNAVLDPVGSNWQDVKGNPQQGLVQAIRDYRTIDKDHTYDGLNAIAPDAALSAEYFGLHNVPGTGDVGKQLHEYNWKDEFMSKTGKNWTTASNAEIVKYTQAVKDQNALQGKKSSEGGQADLMKDDGLAPKEGYFFDPKEDYRGYNVADNFLKQVDKKATDVGYDKKKVWKKSQKKGHTGFGGLGLVSAGLGLAGLATGNPYFTWGGRFTGAADTIG